MAPLETPMEELRRAVAILFRRKGKSSMTEKDFIMAASMDLRWFPPKDAQRLVQSALKAGLIRSEEGHLTPTFDTNLTEVPLDFRPSPQALKAESTKRDIFLEIVSRIASASGRPEREVVAEANATQEGLGVRVEVAALIVGARHGVDLTEFYRNVEEDILTPRTSKDPQG